MEEGGEQEAEEEMVEDEELVGDGERWPAVVVATGGWGVDMRLWIASLHAAWVTAEPEALASSSSSSNSSRRSSSLSWSRNEPEDLTSGTDPASNSGLRGNANPAEVTVDEVETELWVAAENELQGKAPTTAGESVAMEGAASVLCFTDRRKSDCWCWCWCCSCSCICCC